MEWEPFILFANIVMVVVLAWQLQIRRSERKIANYDGITDIKRIVADSKYKDVRRHLDAFARAEVCDAPPHVSVIGDFLLEYEMVGDKVHDNLIKIDHVLKYCKRDLELIDETKLIDSYDEKKGRGLADQEFKGVKHLIDRHKFGRLYKFRRVLCGIRCSIHKCND